METAPAIVSGPGMPDETAAAAGRVAAAHPYRGTGGGIREERAPVAAKGRTQELVDALLARGGCVTLEAGCGSATHLALDGAERIVGIDLSRAQLARNSLLDERVVGDLETFRFPPAHSISSSCGTCWSTSTDRSPHSTTSCRPRGRERCW